jgi:hypothetical protein
MASQLLKKGIQKEEEAFLKRLRLYVDKKHHSSVETVQGPGSRVQGPGFRVQGPGSRVQGPGFRVQGSGSRVQGPGFRVQRRLMSSSHETEARWGARSSSA